MRCVPRVTCLVHIVYVVTIRTKRQVTVSCVGNPRKSKVQAEWNRWRKLAGIRCDRTRLDRRS